MKIHINKPGYSAHFAQVKCGAELICNLDKGMIHNTTETSSEDFSVTYTFGYEDAPIEDDVRIQFTPETGDEVSLLTGYEYVQHCKGQFVFLYVKSEFLDAN